jgi:tetratricopeptide (TPR) repeat protein
MQNSKIVIAALFITGLLISGYQCASTELTSARLYIQQKNYVRALEVLQEDVSKNPKSDEGYFLLGVVYGEMNDMNKMVESFDKSLSISGKFTKEISEYRISHWSTYFNRGVSDYKKGTETENIDSAKIYFNSSIENYKTAIMLEPDSANNYRNIAYAYLTAGNLDASIDPLKKLIELEKPEDGYQYLGEIYSTLGANKMIEYQNTKNTQDSVDAIAYYNLGISVLTEGKQKFPANAEISASLTQSYIGAGRIDEALKEARVSVAADPQNKDYKYNYGVLLLNTNEFAEAENQFLQALEIDPEFENANYNLAVTYVKWGTEMNRAAEEKGIISEEYKEKYQKALPYLEGVVEADPENIQMWELIGKVYTVLGMTEDAENAFSKADALRE